jgi:hypothetical protein
VRGLTVGAFTMKLNASEKAKADVKVLGAGAGGGHDRQSQVDSSDGVYPTLDTFPYGTTSPIYLTVGGLPARSPEDARYFMAWIDRMRAAVEAHRDWNTEAERRETLDMLARARGEYERRAAE